MILLVATVLAVLACAAYRASIHSTSIGTSFGFMGSVETIPHTKRVVDKPNISAISFKTLVEFDSTRQRSLSDESVIVF